MASEVAGKEPLLENGTKVLERSPERDVLRRRCWAGRARHGGSGAQCPDGARHLPASGGTACCASRARGSPQNESAFAAVSKSCEVLSEPDPANHFSRQPSHVRDPRHGEKTAGVTGIAVSCLYGSQAGTEQPWAWLKHVEFIEKKGNLPHDLLILILGSCKEMHLFLLNTPQCDSNGIQDLKCHKCTSMKNKQPDQDKGLQHIFLFPSCDNCHFFHGQA
ncbi:uncharacterized protein LOC125695265 [Lagopus muta]|uniref:uncharacterized protein LOC125695265 n=1 Tax=Lagopus muta TaxID=64668 RepID=UPI00209DBF93|nr:uncharacterized protein LOC125695265 [Lagopus muta]